MNKLASHVTCEEDELAFFLFNLNYYFLNKIKAETIVLYHFSIRGFYMPLLSRVQCFAGDQHQIDTISISVSQYRNENNFFKSIAFIVLQYWYMHDKKYRVLHCLTITTFVSVLVLSPRLSIIYRYTVLVLCYKHWLILLKRNL